MEVDLSKLDTSYYIYCSFQNMEYSQIIDRGSVYITSRYSLDKTINELNIREKYNLPDDRGKWYKSVKQNRSGMAKIQKIPYTAAIQKNALFSF